MESAARFALGRTQLREIIGWNRMDLYKDEH
jgi:hypothetical protein